MLGYLSNLLCTYRPWDKDRFFAPDINAVTQLLKEGKVSTTMQSVTIMADSPYLSIQVWDATRVYIEEYQAEFSELA